MDLVTSVIEEIEKQKKKRDKQLVKNEKPVKIKKLTKKQQQIVEIANETILPENYHIVWTEEQLNNMCAHIKHEEYLAIDTETKGLNPFLDEIVGFSLWLPEFNQGYYIPLKHVDDIGFAPPPEGGQIGIDYVKCLPKEIVINKVKPLLEDNSIKLILHNSKFDMHVLYNWLGIKITPYFDTMIASALLDENQPKGLKELSGLYLKEPADKFTELFGKETFDTIPILLKDGRRGCLAGYYAIKDTYMTYRLYEFFNSALNRPGLENIKKLFFELEMPFISIVWDSEQHGVKFDLDYIKNVVAPQLYKEYEELSTKIKEYLGDINLKSPLQLSEVLYKKLNLPVINKKKPLSTDKRTLVKLKNTHPVIPLLLEFRAKAKLIDAFVEKLPRNVVNGRIHTSFQTIGCVTGRMSSSNPKVNWGLVA